MKNKLSEVLALPEYVDYEEYGADDYRMAGVANASFSISSKGWYDHVSAESGSLDSLLKRDRKVIDTYERAKVDDDAVRAYLKTRRIDFLPDVGIRKHGQSLVIPLRAASGELVQLVRIKLNKDGTKDGHAIVHGKAYRDRAIHINRGSDVVYVIEGLEDAAVLAQHLPDADIMVSAGATNFKRVLSFLLSYKHINVILDNDSLASPPHASMKQSMALGPNVTRLMPVDPGIDANKALQQGWLDEWFATLEPVEYDEQAAKAVSMQDWPEVDKDGKPLNTIPNLESLLGRLEMSCRKNVITKMIEVDGGGEYDASLGHLISQCHSAGLSSNHADQFLKTIADRNAFNPVAEWILSEPPDGNDHIGELCETVKARVDFDDHFKNKLIKKWLMSAVIMAFNDDAREWSKGVLTFQGAQNIGKTSWFNRLLPEALSPLSQAGLIFKAELKDSVMGAIRHWLVELGELESTFRRSDIAQLKAFLTNRKDVVRLPYAHAESVFPRRTAFFASVNKPNFLQDMTGNVRFWVIPVIELDYTHSVNMQQVFAQAHAMTGHHFLDDDESTRLETFNESARELDPIEELVISAIDDPTFWKNREPMTASAVLMSLGVTKPTQRELQVGGSVLRRFFGEPVRMKNGRFFPIGKINGSVVPRNNQKILSIMGGEKNEKIS